MNNIEIKAMCSELDQHRIREVLKTRNARFDGEDHQVDTYFKVSRGRLKLREGNIENALIYYDRLAATGPKESKVILYPNPDPSLKNILSKALGVLVVVDKKREIYRIDNLKIHIDTVKGLGSFVEVEAGNDNGAIGKIRRRKQCEEYLSLFEIADDQLIAESYSDLTLKQARSASMLPSGLTTDPAAFLAPAEKARRTMKKHLMQLEEDELFNLGIEHLDFTRTTFTKLKDAGISYIGELIQLTAEELGCSAFNDKNVDEIKSKLANINLSLGMSPDYWPPDELLQ